MQQSNLFSPGSGNGSALINPGGNPNDPSARLSRGLPSVDGPHSAQRPPHKARGRRRWLTVLLLGEFLLAITVRIVIGVIVMVLPWSPMWDNNHLFQTIPHLATLMSYGATRGIISGLGLLNLWIAVDDTLHRNQRYR